MAILGIYGVTSHSVSTRRRELAIRRAFGADRRGPVRMVVRQGMLLAATGLCIGTVLALVLSRALSKMLFGIGPQDPITLLATMLLLAVTSLTACYLPARRATRQDAMESLRCD